MDDLTVNWEPELLLWPDLEYRKEFVRILNDYILDKDRKYNTVDPGIWGPGAPLPPTVRSYFAVCVKDFIDSLFDGPLRKSQPPQEFEENYAMGRFLQQNEDPFSSIALTVPRGNNNYEGFLDGFNNLSPSTAGDPRAPIRDLHRHQTDFFSTPLTSGVFPRGTHEAERMGTVTEITRERYVGPFHRDGGLAPPPPQPTTMGSHNSARSGGSALGRRRRDYSGEGSTSVGSQAATRRTKTRRNPPPPSTATGEAGPSSRGFGADARSVDGGLGNTTSTGTVSKESFKHKCGMCGERFEFPARLKSHMETISHAERKYRCHLCGSVFSRKSSLKRHQDAATACKAQGRNDSPPPSASESGARDAAFRSVRGARQPSMASPSHGNVSPSNAGNQSVSSRDEYRQYGPASAPRASFGGGSHLSPMARTASQHRSLPASVAPRGSHRPQSTRSYIDPRVLQPTSGGYNDCDQIRTGNGCGT